jgi:hypothetical protein
MARRLHPMSRCHLWLGIAGSAAVAHLRLRLALPIPPHGGADYDQTPRTRLPRNLQRSGEPSRLNGDVRGGKVVCVLRRGMRAGQLLWRGGASWDVRTCSRLIFRRH